MARAGCVVWEIGGYGLLCDMGNRCLVLSATIVWNLLFGMGNRWQGPIVWHGKWVIMAYLCGMGNRW